MIGSTASDGERIHHGIQIPLRAFSGAEAARVIGGSHATVVEHLHDWPVLSLYVAGACRKFSGDGECTLNGPSVVLHGARRSHSNRMGEVGLEQVDVMFDPAWLHDGPTAGFDRVHCWSGGPVAHAGSRLASLWADEKSTEAELAAATRKFLAMARSSEAPRRPRWLEQVLQRLESDCPPTALELGVELDLHPGWLASSYREAMGEGLRETVRRRRVERATALLRNGDGGLADVAAASGFCDQSHMNRSFRHLLGRTPAEVRRERERLRPSSR